MLTLKSHHTLFDMHLDYMHSPVFQFNSIQFNLFVFISSHITIGFTIGFKNNGNPTRITRLKVAPNMADPTSTKHPVSSLKQYVMQCFQAPS